MQLKEIFRAILSAVNNPRCVYNSRIIYHTIASVWAEAQKDIKSGFTVAKRDIRAIQFSKLEQKYRLTIANLFIRAPPTAVTSPDTTQQLVAKCRFPTTISLDGNVALTYPRLFQLLNHCQSHYQLASQ